MKIQNIKIWGNKALVLTCKGVTQRQSGATSDRAALVHTTVVYVMLYLNHRGRQQGLSHSRAFIWALDQLIHFYVSSIVCNLRLAVLFD